jgi:hypothetical protein
VVIATKAAGPNAGISWVRGGRAQLRRRQPARGGRRQPAAPANRAYRFIPIALAPQRAHLRQQQLQPQQERDCVAIEDTLAALGDLVKEGKIGAIGVSNESCWGVSEFIKQSEMKGLPRIAIQNLYNLTARHYETSLLDETCYRERQPAGLQPARVRPADRQATTIRRRRGA